MPKKVTTLKDIAHKTGFSVMAVSMALNGKPGIAEDTRETIIRAAREMNYSQNMVARGLRLKETKTIGVLRSDSSEMVMSALLRGIEAAAAPAGYSLILGHTDRNTDNEKCAIQTLVDKRIDGLILVAPLCHSGQDIRWLMGFGVPLLFLLRKNSRIPVDSVTNDNRGGGRRLTEHLLGRGCRDFAFLPLDRLSQNGTERLAGSRKALETQGLALDAKKLLHTTPDVQSGYENTKTLLSKGCAFDALVCGSDVIAVGALEALREAGLRVPQDVRVTGYDDLEWVRYLRVPLTTMRQPFFDIGLQGAEMLLGRIGQPERAVQKLVLASELVARESA